MADDIHPLEQQRRDNRDRIAQLGFSPYGTRNDGITPIADAKDAYNEQADQAHQTAGKNPPEDYTDQRPVCTVAGRIVLHRDNGKLVWLNLRDNTGDMQVAVSARDCDEQAFNLAKALDLGDVVVATGPVMKTRTGEVTIWASTLDIASKSLALPPEKHAGLQDVEQRYRKRYVDMYTNPETIRVFQVRSRLVSRVRSFLEEQGYLEVDTPVLQQLAGGAAARPFRTHMNALDIDLFLRIAPELYLKRLLVGGLPRVFEMSRNFRNEGVDKSHNPEFTSLEIYQAFGDYMTMLELAESLVRELALVASKHLCDEPTLRLPFGELEIDYETPFARVTYAELFEKTLGFPMSDRKKTLEAAKKHNLKHEGLDHVLIVNELFEEIAEPTIDPAKPTFVLDYPAALSPLTRPKADNPEIAERWDLFIGGMEIGPAYTELNDPDIQERMFRQQLAGIDDEESTFRTFDDDFIEALKVGMPPAGGLGLGIDRLTMLLTNQRTIRDVLLFPMMRPIAAGAPAEPSQPQPS